MWLVHASTEDQYDNTTITNWNSTSTDLPGDDVQDMAIDNNDKIYFGLNGGNGISIYDNGSWSHYPNHTGGLANLNNVPFPKFLETDPVNNTIFLGEFSNVHLIYDNNTMSTFDNTNLFSTFNSANISCMTVTQDGKIWFGIESFANDPATSGIFMYDGNTWTHYNTNNSSLPVNGITAMLTLMLNGMEKDVEVEKSIEGENVALSSTIDVKEFKAQASVDSLNAVCEDLHTGADGVSKLWSEVDLNVTTTLKKSCE